MVTQVVRSFLSIALQLQLVLLLHRVINPESSQVMDLVQSHVQALRLDSGRRCRGADHRRGSTNFHHLCSPRGPVVTDRRRECTRMIFDESSDQQSFSCCFTMPVQLTLAILGRSGQHSRLRKQNIHKRSRQAGADRLRTAVQTLVMTRRLSQHLPPSVVQR